MAIEQTSNQENQAFIFAAGRGKRMRPLTDITPKPLLKIHNKPLIEWAMDGLHRSGIERVLINTAWLGDQVSTTFGTSYLPHGSTTPCKLTYSHEGLDFGHALETAGGVVRALPALEDIFWVLAGDVFAPSFTFDPAALRRFTLSAKLAHIWLVPNPSHNLEGDFGLSPKGLALNSSDIKWTYSTIGLYRKALFASPYCQIVPGNPYGQSAPLAPLLRSAIQKDLVSAEIFNGAWTDVGTPERLSALNSQR